MPWPNSNVPSPKLAQKALPCAVWCSKVRRVLARIVGSATCARICVDLHLASETPEFGQTTGGNLFKLEPNSSTATSR